MADYGSGQYEDRRGYEQGERTRSGYDTRRDLQEHGRGQYEPHNGGYPQQGQDEPYRGGYQQAGPPPKKKDNRLKYVLVGVGVFAVLAACGAIGGGSDTSSTPTSSAATSSSSPATASTQTVPAAAQAPATIPAAEPVETAVDLDVTVPNVVGMDLQSAQELLFPALRTTSYDNTGQGRRQLVDSNWIVVRQEPAAGSVVLTLTDIALYVEKIGE